MFHENCVPVIVTTFDKPDETGELRYELGRGGTGGHADNKRVREPSRRREQSQELRLSPRPRSYQHHSRVTGVGQEAEHIQVLRDNLAKRLTEGIRSAECLMVYRGITRRGDSGTRICVFPSFLISLQFTVGPRVVEELRLVTVEIFQWLPH